MPKLTNKQMSRLVRLREWSDVLRRRRESGLTVRAYCDENGINEKTYYYWQNKVRQATCEQISNHPNVYGSLVPSGWAQISTVPQQEETLAIEIGSARIMAGKNTSSELLEKVCRVLVSLC